MDAAGTTKYTYHANGQLLTEDGPWTSDIVTYGYNNARLRNSRSLQQLTGNWTNGFNYDAARRLSTVISPAGIYVGRARVRTDYTWSGFLNVMLGTRGSGSLPRQVERGARVLGEH